MSEFRHCQYCGRAFTAVRKDAQCCSSSCRTMMSRERRYINKAGIDVERQIRQIAKQFHRDGLAALARERLERFIQLIEDILDT